MKLYAVKRNDLYFRPRGYKGSGSQWVSLEKAKLYTLGHAKKHLKYYPTSVVVEFELTYVQDMDFTEEVRIKKEKQDARAKKIYEKMEAERIMHLEEEIKYKQDELEKAKRARW